MGKLASLLFALWAAPSCLAIDIPETPTWPSGKCTDKSLTIPSWILSDYKVTGGRTSFRVEARAADWNGINADIWCDGYGDCSGSSGSSEMKVSISKGPDGTIVHLTHFWVCGDAGEKVTFTGSGSTVITSCSGNDCVSPIPYLIQGKTTLPVPLQPVQPTPPRGYNLSSCAKVGEDQWTVKELTYKKYTKGQCKYWWYEDELCVDPPNFLSKGEHLSLKVTNNAIEHEVTCQYSASYQHYDLPTPLRCTGGNFNEITLDVSLLGSAPNFDLRIEQLWYCLENPSTNINPSVIVASGSTSLPLNCSTSAGITGAADDIITTCIDPSGTRSLAGKQTAKKSLPAFSLITAWPAQGGCTFDSIINPTWYMRGMFFETTQYPVNDPESAMLARFTCGLTGPGFADYFFYNKDKALSGSGIKSVYNCNSYGDGKPTEEHWKCQYSLDPFKKILSLNKVWECSDKDRAHPLFFDGSGTFDWKVTPFYRCSSTDTWTSCYWHGDTAVLQPGVPYKIPTITVSLEKEVPERIVSMRINGNWTLDGIKDFSSGF